MTRKEKIERIKRYRPSLYMRLVKEVPNIVIDPDHANPYDINYYNEIIAEESDHETFKKNFSF